jgi:hypothetical protein
MEDAIHPKEYGLFPAEVRGLVEEWKIKWLEAKGRDLVVAANDDKKCDVIDCELEKYERYRFCFKHKAIAEVIMHECTGLRCSVDKCVNKLTRFSRSSKCSSCNTRDKAQEPLQGTNEHLPMLSTAAIKDRVKEDFAKVVKKRAELAKKFPNRPITVYFGQTMQQPEKRWEQHSQEERTKGAVDRIIVARLNSVFEMNTYEHELIRYGAEVLGNELIVNNAPGGGSAPKNMLVKGVIYALFFTRHEFRTDNDRDYSLPLFAHAASYYGKKLPAPPKLPPMPKFYKFLSHAGTLRMLRYQLKTSVREMPKEEYPCLAPGCTKVFPTANQRYN